MRVITGTARGRRLKELSGTETRPTTDRVKEGLFNIIQFDIEGRRVLDLFAGSGALGLEAISNGAKTCYLIDNNQKAIETIKENSINIKEDLKIIHTDYKKFLKETSEKFDVIFLDPPYQNNQLNKALRIIEERDLLNNNGIVVCEYEIGMPITNLKLLKEKSYGPKKIKIFGK